MLQGNLGWTQRSTDETHQRNKVLVVEMLSNEHHHKLNVMYRQLGSKAKVLAELDNDIVNSEILKGRSKNLMKITTKIIKYKAPIEFVKQPMNTTKPV